MLYLIVASILTLTTLADLESVTEEWIAPGVDISRETLVEFAEHGEMFQNESEPYVGCHVTFVEVDGQEKWRAVVVYADRVVLFQEDQNPLVTLHDFPVDNLCFSESGNFVVLHDGGAVDTDRNGLRINTETGESIFFDSQPEGLLDGRVQSIRNDGSIHFGISLNWDAHFSRVFFLSPDFSLNSHDLRYAWVPGVSDNYLIMSHSGGITCFNKLGEILWEDSPSVWPTCMPSVSISEDGLFLLPTANVIQLRSCQTGELIHTYSLPNERTYCETPLFSLNSTDWLCSARTYNTQVGEIKYIILSGNVNSDRIHSRPFPAISFDSGTHSSLVQNSETNMLIRTDGQPTALFRFVITDDSFSPLFATLSGQFSGTREGLQSRLYAAEAALDFSGKRAICISLNCVCLIEIGE